MTQPKPILRLEKYAQVFLLFSYGFGNAAAYLLARTVADTEFLSRFGSDRLPQLYLVSAVSVALISILYGRVLRRVGLKRSIVLTLVSFAVLSCCFAVAIPFAPTSFVLFVGAYLLAQFRGSLGTIQFATVLNEQYYRRGPVHVVGVVGAGATLAGVMMGTLVSKLPDSVPVESLLYLAAFIDIATIFPLLSLRALRKKSKKRDKKLGTKKAKARIGKRSKKSAGFRDIFQSRYVTGVMLLVCCTIITTTIIEFQWKSVAADELERNSHEMARYFGWFYGVVYGLTGVTQLLLTSRILQRNSMLFGLLIYPICLLTCIGMVVANATGSMLGALSMCKGTDTIRRSIHDPTIQVLYSPLAKHFRRRAITFVSGIAKPFAEAAAAVFILGICIWVPTQKLHYFTLPLILAWIVAAVWLWFMYRHQSDGENDVTEQK